MPDVPAGASEILAATRARAGVVSRQLLDLQADLAASTGGPAADPAVRQQGVELLAAAAAALAALEELIPQEVAGDSPPTPGDPEKHDHGRP
jgi:hypothetical protein